MTTRSTPPDARRSRIPFSKLLLAGLALAALLLVPLLAQAARPTAPTPADDATTTAGTTTTADADTSLSPRARLTGREAMSRLAVDTEPYRAAIVVEPMTGTVLHEKNADTRFATASMIKMLTALVTLEEIEKGTIDWDTQVKTSAEVSLTDGRQVYLKQGEVFSVRELLAAVMIHSANDASAALAEAISGDQAAFVELMRDKARRLGIENPEVHTPNGLPKAVSFKGAQGEDRMSPRELALIGMEVMKHPELTELSKTKTRPFRHGEFQLYNSNHLLRKYDGALGLKTGYHRDADFCVTAAAQRGDMTLITVIMGAPRKHGAFDGAAALFDAAFDRYQLIQPLKQGEVLRAEAVLQDGRGVQVESGQDVVELSRRQGNADVRIALVSNRPAAPVRVGDEVGELVVYRQGRVIDRAPALAAAPVGASDTWGEVKGWFWGLWV